MAVEKKDALQFVLDKAGFNLNVTQLWGPMSFMFSPALDENVRVLVQALVLVVILSLCYILDREGAFAHIKSRRDSVPPLLVAICQPEDLDQIRKLARRRGIVDDPLTAAEELDANGGQPHLPRRGDSFHLVSGSQNLAGIVLEAGLPRASPRGRRDWASRWAGVSCTVALLPGGDCVLATITERNNVSGFVLRRRFPRFLRKAYRRRTARKTLASSTVTFFSLSRNQVIGIAPLSASFAKDVLEALPKLESRKSK